MVDQQVIGKHTAGQPSAPRAGQSVPGPRPLAVFRRTLWDQRRSLLAWTISLVLLVLMYASMWPSLKGQPSMSSFLDNMPEALRNLFAMAGADLSTPAGYVQVEFLSFMAPILLLLHTVANGTTAIAGEEDRRTLDLLLSVPVSRPRIVLEKAAALVATSLFLTFVLGLSIWSIGRGFDMALSAGAISSAMVHLWLLALVFGALALAIGAGTGRPGMSRALPAVLAVVAYVVNGLAPLASWLKPLRGFSPFYQYAGHDPLRQGVGWPGVGIAVAEVVVLVGIAVFGFRRRDVAA